MTEVEYNKRRSEFIGLMQNPHAAEEIETYSEWEARQNTSPPPMPSPISLSSRRVNFAPMGKNAFDTECRRIFRQYSPMGSDKIGLPERYRTFISTHRDLSPIQRGFIVSELRKYDLSDLGTQNYSLNQDFDEAGQVISEAKLADISRMALEL